MTIQTREQAVLARLAAQRTEIAESLQAFRGPVQVLDRCDRWATTTVRMVPVALPVLGFALAAMSFTRLLRRTPQRPWMRLALVAWETWNTLQQRRSPRRELGRI